jgi:hypothetical protein
MVGFLLFCFIYSNIIDSAAGPYFKDGVFIAGGSEESIQKK